jgi:hypothetical protein
MYPVPLPTVDEIFFCVGYLFAIAYLYAKYDPCDFQFMLSLHKNHIKIIGFDFGRFTPIVKFTPLLVDKIFNDFVLSPYLGAWINKTHLIFIDNMIKGMATIANRLDMNSDQYQIGYRLLIN